jgi:hypothetical protein
MYAEDLGLHLQQVRWQVRNDCEIWRVRAAVRVLKLSYYYLGRPCIKVGSDLGSDDNSGGLRHVRIRTVFTYNNQGALPLPDGGAASTAVLSGAAGDLATPVPDRSTGLRYIQYLSSSCYRHHFTAT